MRSAPQEKISLKHKHKPCNKFPMLTKVVWSRRLDIGLIRFCLFMDSISFHKHTKEGLKVNMHALSDLDLASSWSKTYLYCGSITASYKLEQIEISGVFSSFERLS